MTGTIAEMMDRTVFPLYPPFRYHSQVFVTISGDPLYGDRVLPRDPVEADQRLPSLRAYRPWQPLSFYLFAFRCGGPFDVVGNRPGGPRELVTSKQYSLDYVRFETYRRNINRDIYGVIRVRSGVLDAGTSRPYASP